jgi:hypothetical protein
MNRIDDKNKGMARTSCVTRKVFVLKIFELKVIIRTKMVITTESRLELRSILLLMKLFL